MIAASGKRIIPVYASPDDGWRQRLEDRFIARANDRERFPAGLSVEAWNDEYLAELAHAPDTLRDEVENVAVMLFLVSRSFPRPGNPLGHYQVVLLLLAVDTGTPMLARNFFALVERGATAATVSEVPHDIGWLMKEMDQDWLEDAAGWQRLRGWLMTHDEEVPADTRLAVLAP